MSESKSESGAPIAAPVPTDDPSMEMLLTSRLLLWRSDLMRGDFTPSVGIFIDLATSRSLDGLSALPDNFSPAEPLSSLEDFYDPDAVRWQADPRHRPLLLAADNEFFLLEDRHANVKTAFLESGDTAEAFVTGHVNDFVSSQFFDSIAEIAGPECQTLAKTIVMILLGMMLSDDFSPAAEAPGDTVPAALSDMASLASLLSEHAGLTPESFEQMPSEESTRRIGDALDSLLGVSLGPELGEFIEQATAALDAE